MSDTARIIKLASEAGKFFVSKTRESTGERFVSAPDAPEWLSDLIREAHGDMLPDDYRYEMIRNALSAISEASEDASASDLDDLAHEFADNEPDVYNSGRSAWLASHLSRAGYVDEAVQEYGLSAADFDVFQAIAMGWYAEAREVFGLVLSNLEEVAQEQEDAEEEANAQDETVCGWTDPNNYPI